MKQLIILLLFIVACSTKPEKENQTSLLKDGTKQQSSHTIKKEQEPASTDTFVLGDINSDKITDTAFVFTPSTIRVLDKNNQFAYMDGYKDSCFNIISFSCDLPPIQLDNSVWASVEKIGDINKDGIAELLVVPGWFMGCRKSIYPYSFYKNKWNNKQVINADICGEEPFKLFRKGSNYYFHGDTLIEADYVEKDILIYPIHN